VEAAENSKWSARALDRHCSDIGPMPLGDGIWQTSADRGKNTASATRKTGNKSGKVSLRPDTLTAGDYYPFAKQ